MAHHVLGKIIRWGKLELLEDGSTALESLIALVTERGLPASSGISHLRGRGLLARIHSRQDALLKELSDETLVTLCTEGGFYRAGKTATCLIQRIRCGNVKAFHLLRNAVACHPTHKRLAHCYAEVVHPIQKDLESMTRQDLESMQESSADPVKAFAATLNLAQERWRPTAEEMKATSLRTKQERTAKRAQAKAVADANIIQIAAMAPEALIDGLNRKQFEHSRRAKTALITRLLSLTVGLRELEPLVPVKGGLAVKEYFAGLGVFPLGFVRDYRSRYYGYKWDRWDIMKASARAAS